MAAGGFSPQFTECSLLLGGINYNDLPTWQKRGIGIYYRNFEKQGFNPKTGENTTAIRRELFTDMEIPVGEEYRKFVLGFIEDTK